jgi:hypothetical protein
MKFLASCFVNIFWGIGLASGGGLGFIIEKTKVAFLALFVLIVIRTVWIESVIYNTFSSLSVEIISEIALLTG